MSQRVNTLYNQPIQSSDGAPPLTIRVEVPHQTEYVGGASNTSIKTVTYVLWDVLSDELKQRVVTAIQALTAAG
jgi:hypothetical protein